MKEWLIKNKCNFINKKNRSFEKYLFFKFWVDKFPK